MSEHKYETFIYTPIELAESMTVTVHDTLTYLRNREYITDADYEHLSNTLAVYPMPNRKGFGKRLLERFFGKDSTENAYVFPIIQIDSSYTNNPANSKGKTKPKLNVVEGEFGKDKK